MALIPYRSRMNPRDISQPESWHQILPLRAFLDAAFSNRLRFGVPANAHAIVSVRVALTSCWYRRCRARTRILTSIDIDFGPNECSFSIPELGKHSELLRSILDRLPSDPGMGEIKPRFSEAQGRFYISNGCWRCDRIFGEHFEIHARADEKTLVTFPIRISEEWRHAIEGHDAFERTWGVYPLAAQAN